MNITFYQFTKRTNSTKIVDVAGTTLSCELKSSTSIFNPGLVINGVPASWNPIWNYCYIPGFSRYYFINNWTWLNGVWECACVCDVLASFKTEIGNLSEYVLRSSAESDMTILDSAYIAKTVTRPTIQQLPAFFNQGGLNSGFYIIGIIGKDSTATQGAITYYQMTPTEMARLRAYMLSDTFLSDQGLVQLADFVPADATKVIYNPFQYIVSCKWFPFNASVISSSWKDSVSVINFGWWTTGTGYSAYRLKETVPSYERLETIILDEHPYAATRGTYLNHSPYTERILTFSPFGSIPLPDSVLNTAHDLGLRLSVDFISGLGTLTLEAIDNEPPIVTSSIVGRLTANIGVDIQLAQVGIDYLGARVEQLRNAGSLISNLASAGSGIDMSSVGSAASSAITAGMQAGYAIDTYEIAGMNNYLKAKAPQLLTSGSNGSLAAYSVNNYVSNIFYLPVDEDNPQLGRPLCRVKTLNTIPGFIMVRSPDVAIACFEVERALIVQFLSNGFFYE